MSSVKAPGSQAKGSVNLTLNVQDAKKLLTALTHALQSGGLKKSLAAKSLGKK